MGDSKKTNNQHIKDEWVLHYKTAPVQLNKMSQVQGLISAFNANVDAVIKLSGDKIDALLGKPELEEKIILGSGGRQILCKEDVLRGIIHCFRSGIAEEWLVEEESVYSWLKEDIGFDRLQMGGQGGIVANVMSVCGVNPVFVHCASLPSTQARLFLDRENLMTVDQDGKLIKAHSIDRSDDIPLIHWIIEFDKGDSISVGGQTIVCPKSNRFIATYDPLNFRLHIDKNFASEMTTKSSQLEIIILSGYQMLRATLGDGTRGESRIDESMKTINDWRANSSGQIVHLEMASTQDKVMRKYLLDTLAKSVDSLGFNERELIDLLEVMDEFELAAKCESVTSAYNLFEGMLKLFYYTGVPRLQLHMFGLYLTIQKPGFQLSALQNRNGMQLAAVIAAAKAGTGSIDSEDVLLWAKDERVSDQGIEELKNLSLHISENYEKNDLITTGIWSNPEFDLIAVPTILIDKPVSLVGMGDTISSISLVAAR